MTSKQHYWISGAAAVLVGLDYLLNGARLLDGSLISYAIFALTFISGWNIMSGINKQSKGK